MRNPQQKTKEEGSDYQGIRGGKTEVLVKGLKVSVMCKMGKS